MTHGVLKRIPSREPIPADEVQVCVRLRIGYF